MRKMILAPVLASVLVSALALSSPASAGDMQFGGYPAPPTPTPTPGTQSFVVKPPVDSADTNEEAILNKTLLNLIESVLALL